MRAYFFGNMYLSSIQQGIQAKHCGDEMVVKYAPEPSTTNTPHVDGNYAILYDYLKNHKTVICLNAGYSSTLHEIYAQLNNATDNPYPFAKFHESEEALDGTLTSVGIVIPDAIYETAAEVRATRRDRERLDNFNNYGEWTADNPMVTYTFTKFQVWLINEINKYGLAK